ncbi:hypothetical protein CBR_g38115 [Chara braunii]|uniref:Uncharacterized protein n=1 Tax=Chara braunii TaxID=69332 RepID=A0A388LPD8_CHABU|nr:hypothetical protein CBR_g38115 [Chara braunii]|eukprot:GBG84141.1 hypothetical protein CBR_g38115 [Chara braunii]
MMRRNTKCREGRRTCDEIMPHEEGGGRRGSGHGGGVEMRICDWRREEAEWAWGRGGILSPSEGCVLP